MAKKAFMDKKVADKQIKYGSEEKNRKGEYHLECWTVCSRDLDTDGNLEEEVRSFWKLGLEKNDENKLNWKKSKMKKFGKELVKKNPS